MSDKILDIHLISDSSGETASVVCSSVISQFEGYKFNKFIWPMTRKKEDVDAVINSINNPKSIVFYTIVDRDLREYFKHKAHDANIPFISAIGHVMYEFAKIIGNQPNRQIPGSRHLIFDEAYTSKIEALDYTIAHDDGQNLKTFNDADIVIFGVSRTSKSPTSLYLANRGYKVANLPIISEIPVPLDIKTLNSPLLVGFLINPEHLSKIRSSRLSQIGKVDGGSYTNSASVRNELDYAREIYHKHSINIIDVTLKGIEETASEIMNLYFNKTGQHKSRN